MTSPVPPLIWLLVAIVVMNVLLLALTVAVMHVVLVLATYGIRMRASIRDHGEPSESAISSTSREGSRVHPTTYFAYGLRSAVSGGDGDTDDGNRDAPSGECSACGTENDPAFTYCRNCTTKL